MLTQKGRLLCLLTMIICLPAAAAAPAAAPIDAGATQQRNDKARQYYQKRQQQLQPDKVEDPIIRPPSPHNGAATGAQGPTFKLTKINFSTSHFLSRADLQQITAPYMGRQISIAQLRAIVAAVNHLYLKRDIYTAKALLPPQKIHGGRVRIELVEGKLGALEVKNNHYTHSAYLSDSVHQQPGQFVDGKKLQDDLIFFNRTSYTRLHALLEPGKHKGLTRILLLAQEPPRMRVDLFADNAGSRSVGHYRGGLAVHINGPIGIDDRLDANYTGAAGNQSGFASYSAPVNRYNGRLGATYSRGAINIVRGPFQQLDISGHSESTALNFTQPLVATREWLATAAGSISHSRSVTEAAHKRIASSKTDNLSLGFTLLNTHANHQWSTTQTFNLVHRESTPDLRRYLWVYNADASYLQLFGNSPYSALVHLAGQYTLDADTLPSQSLFQIGGVNTVRGYQQGVIAAKHGLYGQLELHRNIGTGLEVFGFFDGGVVYQTRHQHKSISSVGAGLSFVSGQRLNLDLSVGRPLRKISDHQDNYAVDFRFVIHF